MLECVSVPSLICMFFGVSWRFFSDSWKFVYRFCDVCGASGTKNECKKRCQGSLKIIRSWAWKGPQIIKNDTSWRLGGVLETGRFQERSQGGPPPKFWSTFGATWSIWGSILAPSGFWRGPKIHVFLQDQHKSSKNGHQERCQKKHEIMMENWCENEVPWDVKKRFSHYTCCNLRDLACRGIWWKMVIQNASKIDPKWTTWAAFGWHFEI